MIIKDIFYSFQGEGPYIGLPQIFIRFYGCNIHCAYCDEPDFSHQRQSYTIERVLAEITPLLAKKPHSISITGGEPMVQTEAILSLIPHLSLPTYLETNGTLPDKLPVLLPHIDIYSVDYKPGFLAPFLAFMTQLRDFIPAADLARRVFVKVVLTPGFSPEKTTRLAASLAGLGIQVPFIIQPVTPFGTITQRATMADIEGNYLAARGYLSDVRVIGQTHKGIGIR